MRKLRLVIVAATLVAALFAGSGIASAGVGWCDWGSPPPMDAGIASNPDRNPNGMPTPLFGQNPYGQAPNSKFTVNSVAASDASFQAQFPGGKAYLPPGMSNATK